MISIFSCAAEHEKAKLGSRAGWCRFQDDGYTKLQSLKYSIMCKYEGWNCVLESNGMVEAIAFLAM